MHRSAFAILSLATAAASAGARQATQVFVVRNGSDTVAVERYVRTARAITGDVQMATGALIHYVVHLRADGVTDSAVVTDDANGNVNAGTLHFGATSVQIVARLGGTPLDTTFVGLVRPYPGINVSFALYEHILRMAKPAVGDTVRATFVNIRAGARAPLVITRASATAVQIAQNQNIISFTLSADDEIISAAASTSKWTVARK